MGCRQHSQYMLPIPTLRGYVYFVILSFCSEFVMVLVWFQNLALLRYVHWLRTALLCTLTIHYWYSLYMDPNQKVYDRYCTKLDRCCKWIISKNMKHEIRAERQRTLDRMISETSGSPKIEPGSPIVVRVTSMTDIELQSVPWFISQSWSLNRIVILSLPHSCDTSMNSLWNPSRSQIVSLWLISCNYELAVEMHAVYYNYNVQSVI